MSYSSPHPRTVFGNCCAAWIGGIAGIPMCVCSAHVLPSNPSAFGGKCPVFAFRAKSLPNDRRAHSNGEASGVAWLLRGPGSSSRKAKEPGSLHTLTSKGLRLRFVRRHPNGCFGFERARYLPLSAQLRKVRKNLCA